MLKNWLNNLSISQIKIKSPFFEVQFDRKDSFPNGTQNKQGALGQVWVDNEIQIDYDIGLLLHSEINMMGFKNRNCCLAAFFYSETGENLVDLNNFYSDSEGNISTYVNFSPDFDHAYYDDLPLFIPYKELHLDEGENVIYLQIVLYDYSLQEYIDVSEFIRIIVNTNTFDQTIQQFGIIHDLSIYPDVYHDDLEGLLISSSFTLINLENIGCSVAAYFFLSSGDNLKDTNGLYTDEESNVTTYDFVSPESSEQYYEDFTLFLPYSELHLYPGAYDLKCFLIIGEHSMNRILALSSDVYFNIENVEY
jgi:hypothetical protein